MSDIQTKQQIERALRDMRTLPLLPAARALFQVLGYSSDKRIDLGSNSAAAFAEAYNGQGKLNADAALLSEWRGVDMLFQLTVDDLRSSSQSRMLFDPATFNAATYKAFLFFAIELDPRSYTRSELATITREVNKLFTMPVSVLFRHGDSVTLAIVTHRPNKQDGERDVLEKVTLVKDIALEQTHRAQIDILADLSLDALQLEHRFTTFDAFQHAWRQTLDISALNKRFYRELADWYFWALQHVEFPADAEPNAEVRNATGVIRLITRLIFVWFLREKGLIPDALFRQNDLNRLLTTLADNESSYYKAILQNLFFATLNQEMNSPQRPDNRKFRNEKQNYNVTNLYRYRALFKEPETALDLFSTVPFLNGGLFECLDKPPEGSNKPLRIDGFSDRNDNPLRVPNFLFFGGERTVDLSGVYDSKARSRANVRGLFGILERYKFTIAENTPVEQEVALDPELLGQVFENLLASYNPETQTTARKQTGSFYTPREIVSYMVDESLVAYLERELQRSARLVAGVSTEELTERLRHLLAYNDETPRFTTAEVRSLIAAIDNVKILDPASGSGAFPMGILQKLVYVLGKLDPDNKHWRDQQRVRALRETETTFHIGDKEERARRLEDINEAFEYNSSDYGRKLFLIENCIYGVDIQPIAVQISKLRCFIALIVDQQVQDKRENRGARPLPTLETKFVAANTLIGINRPTQMSLRDPQIEALEKDLALVRSQHFSARTPATKRKYRERDKQIRAELSTLLRRDGFSGDTAAMLAGWDPYAQNVSADFFDPEWMFGIDDGFDITIGNPPYVRADASELHMDVRRAIMASGQYETLWEKWDLFIPFIERGYKLLKPGGFTTMIVSDAYCHSKYAQKSQDWFLKNSRVLRLDFLSQLKIFDAAVRNITYLFQKADGTDNQPLRRVHTPEFDMVKLLPTDEQRNLNNRVFFPEDNERQQFTRPTLLLSQLCYISVGMVVHADEKVAKGSFELDDLVSNHKDKVHTKPFVEGKHLARWVPITSKWIEWNTERAPSLFRRPTFPQMYDVSEKLISVDMSAGVGQLRVAYDNKKLYHNHSAWSFVPWHSLAGIRNNSIKKSARYRDEKPPRPDLPKREELEKLSRRFNVKYLLAVMNSTTARDFLRANRRSNIHLYPDDWKQLPIPDVSSAEQQPIVVLVDQILAAKAQNPNADVAGLEREIDEIVYGLYGLTADEIKVVEEATQRN